MRMRFDSLLAALALIAAIACLAKPAIAAEAAGSAVAWLPAASDADVDAAFRRATSERKPLLLYWGAKWCPPCNQLKATLFNRQDFIERSAGFVAVNVDGDLPGAQKLGARFKVRGYPTMVLFKPDGSEITRLPGEADAPQVMAILQLGLAGGRPVKAVLASARAGRPLSSGEWQMLAFYSWDTDEQQLAPEDQRSALLATLAAACPPGATQTRLLLKSLVASADDKPAITHTEARPRVLAVLTDAAASRAHMDVLTASAAELTRAVAGAANTPSRAAFITVYDSALATLAGDASLSRADRSGAFIARIDLARIDLAKDAKTVAVPASLLQAIRAHVAQDDREIRDGYERQAVITTDAYLLSQAGLMAESDKLLEANLAKSHSPFYLMSDLAENAKQRGDKAGALKWYQQAYDTSVGPATRLQWGSSYVRALIELTPQDAPRIEQATSRLFVEAADQQAGFEERNARSLQRLGDKLRGWNAKGAHAASVKRLQQQLDGVCSKIDRSDPQRAACDAVLRGQGASPVQAG